MTKPDYKTVEEIFEGLCDFHIRIFGMYGFNLMAVPLYLRRVIILTYPVCWSLYHIASVLTIIALIALSLIILCVTWYARTVYTLGEMINNLFIYLIAAWNDPPKGT